MARACIPPIIPLPQSYAPAARFSLIPSGLENPGPTVVPVTTYPATPDPARRRGDVKAVNAANVEVTVAEGILFSWTRFFDCNHTQHNSTLGTNRFIEGAGSLATKAPIHFLKLRVPTATECDIVCGRNK